MIENKKASGIMRNALGEDRATLESDLSAPRVPKGNEHVDFSAVGSYGRFDESENNAVSPSGYKAINSIASRTKSLKQLTDFRSFKMEFHGKICLNWLSTFRGLVQLFI